MKGLPAETDFVVIGAGVAACALPSNWLPPDACWSLAKNEVPNFKTVDPKAAAAWMSDEEEVSLHLQDTLEAGDGMCNLAAVKMLFEEGPERIDELIAWGNASRY